MALSHADIAARTAAVDDVDTENFNRLVVAAELDRERHFKYADWSGVDFSNANLRGFDFTGARLVGCKFDDALIGPGPDFNGNPAPSARFEQAELSDVDRGTISLRGARDWHSFSSFAMSEPGSLRKRGSHWHLPDFALFKDKPWAPEMIVVPSERRSGLEDEYIGRFPQASGPNAPESPMQLPRFAISRFPIRNDEYLPFAEELKKTVTGAMRTRPADPVVGVSLEDAEDYCRWLSLWAALSIGWSYAIPTEAEWQHAAAANVAPHFDVLLSEVENKHEARVGNDRNPTLSDVIRTARFERYARLVPRSTRPVVNLQHAAQARALSEKTGATTILRWINGTAQHPLEVDILAPNRWGLFIASGNTAEWCSDPDATLGVAFARKPYRLRVFVSEPAWLTEALTDHQPTAMRGSPQVGFRIARRIDLDM